MTISPDAPDSSTSMDVESDAATADAYVEGDTAATDASLERDAATADAYVEGDAAATDASLGGNAATADAYVEGNAAATDAYVEGNAAATDAYVEGDAAATDASLGGSAATAGAAATAVRDADADADAEGSDGCVEGASAAPDASAQSCAQVAFPDGGIDAAPLNRDAEGSRDACEAGNPVNLDAMDATGEDGGLDASMALHPASDPIRLYASPTGSGTACDQEHPCSLLGARDKVRTLNADMQADIAVTLADGIYSLTEPFELAEQGAIHDSGSNGHVVTYQAASGGRPILSGGTRITGWSLHDPGRSIYRAVVPSTLKTRQLYVGGVRAVRARSSPDAPDYRMYSDTGATEGLYSAHASPEVPDESWRALSHIEVVSRSIWKQFRCPVESAEQRTHHWVAIGADKAFAPPSDWLADVSARGRYRVGDFDGDGKADLLAIGPFSNDASYVQAARSSGSTFQWAPDLAGSVRGNEAATHLLGDFNGDGKADLLIAYEDEAWVWHNDVILSHGPGFSFESAHDWLPGEGRGAAYHLGDFNGDKRTDLMFVRQDESGDWHNEVALSDGSAFHFAATRDWLPGIGKGKTYHIGNFDGDLRGTSDLLLTYQDENGAWRGQVAISDGEKSFASKSANWLPDAGQGSTPSLFDVGRFHADAWGGSDLLVSYRDARKLLHHQVALSSAQGPRLAFSANASLSMRWGLDSYIANFDGDAAQEDDVLMVGAQTRLQIRQPCWAQLLKNSVGEATEPAVSWIENAYELLDTPGEWYLDESSDCVGPETRCIYYIPRPGEDLGSVPVVAPTLERLVYGHGDPAAPTNRRYLHDVRFDGLTFAFATWLEPSTHGGYSELQAGWHIDPAGKLERTPGNVAFSSVKALDMRNCTFVHLGAVGLDIDRGSQNVTIEGNVITDVSSSGIQLGDIDDSEIDPAVGTANNVISNNFVSRVAVEYESAVGIWIGYARNTLIRNNEVGDLPYTGISLGWGWGARSYLGANQIVANFVHDVMQQLHDGGAIYTQSPQPGSSLLRNYVRRSGDLGLYHDDGSQFFFDKNNVVAETRLWFGGAAATTRFNEFVDNWTDLDHFACVWGRRDPVAGFNAQCSVNDNRAAGNIAVGAQPWPPEAQAVMDAAGLEPQYRTLGAGVCGDATCSAGETAQSCPKDCL